MKIYIDSDYTCHVVNDGTMREFDIPFFDNKCKDFIEGYRYIPKGETWTRSDGKVFESEMISPRKDYTKLHATQLEYELHTSRDTVQAATNALSIMGVAVDSEQYTNAAEARKEETRAALQLVYDALNQGQQNKLLKEETVKDLFDFYGVET